MNAAIDQNHRNTLSAWNDSTGLIEDILVDPVLNAVLIFGVVPDGNIPTNYDRAGIDSDSRNTLSAWNDSTSSIEALRCSNNGDLLVKQV